MTLVKFVLIAVALLMLVTFWMNYFWPWARRQWGWMKAERLIRSVAKKHPTLQELNEIADGVRALRKEDRL